MISRSIFAAFVLLCAFVAPTHAQPYTKAQLNAQIGVNFPDNTTFQITPLNERTIADNIVNSIMPTAPVVSGNLACYSGTTGLLQDCGSSPSSLVISAANVTYTAPFTGTVAETQAAFNALRPTVNDFGAKCNGLGVLVTASITSGQSNLTASGGVFTSADIGKAIQVGGAGAAGVPLVTTIASFTDASHIALAATASTTLTAATNTLVEYGSDDTAALQAAAAIGRPVYIPTNSLTCITTSAITYSVPGGGFIGAGWDVPNIISLSLTAPVITVNNNVTLMTFTNFKLGHTSAAVLSLGTSANGINFAGDTEDTLIDTVHTKYNYIGLALGTTAYSRASNIFSEANTSHSIQITDSTGNVGFQWALSNVLAQTGAGCGVNVVTGNNATPTAYSLETWFNISTFANTGGGICLTGTNSNPIQSFRLVGGFMGQDGTDELKFDTHDSSQHTVSDVFIELAGTSATGPTLGTGASGVGNGINITANNTKVLLNNVVAVQNSQNGITTSASVFTQVNASSFTSNGGWGLLAADGSKVSINGSITNANTSGACSFTSNATSAIGTGNAPLASTCNVGFATYSASTWTPTITTTSTVGTPAYSIQVGSYEQIGRQITVRFTITLSGWTGSPTGNVNIAGLPITSANVANDNGGCRLSNYTVTGLAASNISIAGEIAPNTSVITLTQASNTATTPITAAQIGTTASLVGTCVYHN